MPFHCVFTLENDDIYSTKVVKLYAHRIADRQMAHELCDKLRTFGIFTFYTDQAYFTKTYGATPEHFYRLQKRKRKRQKALEQLADDMSNTKKERFIAKE